jgi:hypothetical protein
MKDQIAELKKGKDESDRAIEKTRRWARKNGHTGLPLGDK